MRFTVLVAGFVVLLSSISVSAGDYEDHPKYEPFIAEMVKEHNYDESTNEVSFTQIYVYE